MRDIKESKNSEILTITAQQKRRERDYWLNKLSGEIVKSRFPCDHNSAFVEEVKQDGIPFTFPGDIPGKLVKLGSGLDPNLFIILAAGVMVLMNKYTGNEDIMVGTPVSKQETERNFINTVLAIRNRVSGEMSFKELLLQVRQTIIEAEENQNYPIETLVYKLNLEFDEHNFPLFDTAVLLENIHDKRYLHPIKPNILFSFSRNDRGIRGELEYNALLYERSTIERIIGHLENVCRAMVFNPAFEIANIEILSGEEKKHLLTDFNDNDNDFPADKTIYHFLEKHAEVNPDRIAIIYKEEAMTYGELNNRSNRLARMLPDNGVLRGSLVGILLSRSPLMATCILAAWKAGCAYIPMDTNWPPQRILGVLEDSNAAVLFTRAEYNQPQLEESFEGKIFLSGKYENAPGEKQPSNPGLKADMKGLAYVIYTSGSTGSPKGVMVEHIGMMNHIHAKINDLQLTGRSIVAQNASQCFDISVWQYFSALVPGGRTVIYPDECVLEPALLLSRVIRDQVTILEVVPSYLSVLLSILDLDLKPLNVLNYLLVTGEAVKPVLIRRWFEKYPGIKVVNAYGPTEASDDITHYIMDQAPAAENVPIGKPLWNLNIYIVDKYMKLCPPGVKGEILVSGVGVGRGYLNDPGKTSRLFMGDSFMEGSGLRLFKTGDLGCWLPDGTIEFFGRKDYQVKIRGYRIELEEIEKKLLGCAGIKEVAVIEKEMEPSTSLCAFYTADKKLAPSRVKAYLEEILPPYMIPEYFGQIGQMPFTPNGKVDRKTLAKLEITVNDEEFSAAVNETQQKLVDIWGEVLEIDKKSIGIDANFFQLGGHSIKATLLAARIHKEFNTGIQLKNIFERPTIRTFAKFLKETGKDTFISIEQTEEKEYYPLSAAQRRMFFIQQIEPEGIAYNLQAAYRFENDADEERIEDILKKLIARHESLRTSFFVVDGEPVQKIHEDVDLESEHYETTEELEKNFVRPFTLSQAPLVRVGVARGAAGGCLLALDLHHIIIDFTSYNILSRDFFSLHSGEELPPIKLNYRDYSVFQNSEIMKQKIVEQEKYWLEEFKGEIPVLNFPADFARPEIFNYEGNRLYFEIDAILTGEIKELILETSTTLFMVLLTVFNILLLKYTEQEDIIVMAGALGRKHSDLQNIIGMFINTLALRMYPRRGKTFGKFLEEVKQKVVNAYDNEDYQFEDLIKKLRLHGDISKNLLSNVGFQILPLGEMKTLSRDLKITPYAALKVNRSPADFYLQGGEVNGKINMLLTYSTALFKRSTMERIVKHYVEILSQVLRNKDIKLGDVCLSHNFSALRPNTFHEEEKGEFGF